MSRSTDILSRVFKNLENYNKDINDILDEEAYDAISQGQDKIISEVFPDKIIPITIESGTDSYVLSTDASSVSSPRKNIASVKVAELPTGWTVTDGVRDYGNISRFPDPFLIVNNKEFVDFVNANQGLTGQPRIGTIIGGKLKTYPVPDNSVDGDVLKLYSYLSSSAGVIDDENEPDIGNNFDEALELYATSRFLFGKDRGEFLVQYQNEIRDQKGTVNRKSHPMNRPPVEGLL